MRGHARRDSAEVGQLAEEIAEVGQLAEEIAEVGQLVNAMAGELIASGLAGELARDGGS